MSSGEEEEEGHGSSGGGVVVEVCGRIRGGPPSLSPIPVLRIQDFLQWMYCLEAYWKLLSRGARKGGFFFRDGMIPRFQSQRKSTFLYARRSTRTNTPQSQDGFLVFSFSLYFSLFLSFFFLSQKGRGGVITYSTHSSVGWLSLGVAFNIYSDKIIGSGPQENGIYYFHLTCSGSLFEEHGPQGQILERGTGCG